MPCRGAARITVAFTAALALVLASRATVQGQRGNEKHRFIVNCPGTCPAVAASVRDLGGEVTQVYENIEAIAVEVPAARLADVPTIPGAQAVWKDTLVEVPV